MKKILAVLLFSVLIVAAFFGMNYKQKMDTILNNFVYDYYLCNNENKVYEIIHEGFSMPTFNYSKPFEEDLSKIALNNEMIEAILPYYPMLVSVDDKETTITLSSEKKQKDIVVPLSANGDLYHYIEIVSYTNESLFNDILSVKKLSNDSGIYVTERFFDACHFDTQNKDLSITVTLSIPLSATTRERENYWIEEDTKVEHRDMYDSYEIEEYIEKEYTFPIAGIISKNNMAFQGYGYAAIWIPYELSEKIYQSCQSELNGPIKDGTERWQPSTYIVKLKEKADVDEVGQELLKYLPDFSLEKSDYIEDQGRVLIYSRDNN